MDSADAELPLTAEMIGNAFVKQYYYVLHHSPEIAYLFYNDSSVLCRPNHDGMMTIATTMNRINDVICSLDYKNYEADIETVDAQFSFHGGVFLLVTGSLTGSDHHKKKFTQTFFLAPQDTGYFILNDVFRHLDNGIPEIVLGVDGTLSNNLYHEPSELVEPPQCDAPETLVKNIEAADEDTNGQIVSVETSELPQADPLNHSVKEIGVVEEKDNGQLIAVGPPGPDEDAVVQAKPNTNWNRVPVDSEAVITVSEGHHPKQSYAWVVSSQKKRGPTKIYVPATVVKEAHAKVAKPPVDQTSEVSIAGVSLCETSATTSENCNTPDQGHEPSEAAEKVVKPTSEISTPEVSLPQNPVTAPENIAIPDEGEGHTIYVRYLPPNATVSQLKEVFKKFGPINPAGIQVRRNWQQGFCFGFVEFQEFSSMQSAIKASPIMIGDREAVVEAKRATSRVGSGRNHFASGSFREENFGGQGNFGKRQVYVRTDSNFLNHGSSGSAKAYHQGRGRGGHHNGPSRNLVPAQS